MEQKPGNAVIWKSKFKKPGDNQPDIKGFCTTPDGTRYELAFWKKDDKYTGKIKPPRENGGSAREPGADDDVEF